MTLRILGLILALPTALFAQEKAPPKKQESGVQIRMLAEAAPPEIGKVCLVFGKEKSEGIVLPINQLSEPLTVSERVLVLQTVEKEIPLCTINLPENGKAFAIVLVTAKPAGYSPIIVRTDDPSFKAGDVLFINHSEKTVLGKLGNTPLVLKPNESKKERPSSPKDDTYYDIAFATRDETGDKLISTSRWPIDNQLRSYLFFFTTAEGKTTFRAVDEYMTPPATAKP